MNLPICHREERSDVAIQLESWIAAVGFASFAMTNMRVHLQLGEVSSGNILSVFLGGIVNPRTRGESLSG